MFLSTRKPEAIYKFIIGSCKKNAESQLKKKLLLETFKIQRSPNVKLVNYEISNYSYLGFQVRSKAPYYTITASTKAPGP